MPALTPEYLFEQIAAIRQSQERIEETLAGITQLIAFLPMGNGNATDTLSMGEDEDYILVPEAATLLHISERRMRQLAQGWWAEGDAWKYKGEWRLSRRRLQREYQDRYTGKPLPADTPVNLIAPLNDTGSRSTYQNMHKTKGSAPVPY